MSVFLRTAALALGVAGACAVTTWTANARASVPMGVFARVDAVVYEPNKAAATQVQIHGVFAMHQGGTGFAYSAPSAG